MNVIVDLLVFDPNYKPDEKEKVFYGEMVKFIKQRLALLRDEIELEERKFANNPENQVAMTIVYFIRKPGGLKFRNYTPELTAKMNGCFSKDDFDYLDSKLGEVL